MTQEEKDKEFQAYVDYAIDIYSDMVPYDDPEYEDKVLQLATSYADMEVNGYPPELEALCKLHDEMLERGEIDFLEDELPF